MTGMPKPAIQTQIQCHGSTMGHFHLCMSVETCHCRNNFVVFHARLSVVAIRLHTTAVDDCLPPVLYAVRLYEQLQYN